MFVRSFVSLAFKQKSWTLFILQIALYLGTLEVLVFSYFNREVLSVCLCVIGLGWPASMSSDFRRNNIILLGLWVVFCGLTGIFTLLPVEKVEDIYIV